MQKESKFKIHFRKKLEAIPNSYWEKIQQRTIRGTPDILGVVNGRAIAVELKVDSPIEELQFVKLKKWQEAGALSFIATPQNEDVVIKDIMNGCFPVKKTRKRD